MRTAAMKHPYKVRPGYRSEKLLIEFGPDSSDERFVSDLRSVLAAHGLIPKSEQDLVFMFIRTFDSPGGVFELTCDEWSMVWVQAEENQDAIMYVDRILSESGRFQKESVRFEDYAMLGSSLRSALTWFGILFSTLFFLAWGASSWGLSLPVWIVFAASAACPAIAFILGPLRLYRRLKRLSLRDVRV